MKTTGNVGVMNFGIYMFLFEGCVQTRGALIYYYDRSGFFYSCMNLLLLCGRSLRIEGAEWICVVKHEPGLGRIV